MVDSRFSLNEPLKYFSVLFARLWSRLAGPPSLRLRLVNISSRMAQLLSRYPLGIVFCRTPVTVDTYVLFAWSKRTKRSRTAQSSPDRHRDWRAARPCQRTGEIHLLQKFPLCGAVVVLFVDTAGAEIFALSVCICRVIRLSEIRRCERLLGLLA